MSLTTIQVQRDYLHNILTGLSGVKKVYFQPPSSEKLVYPCIIYNLNGIDNNYANGSRYLSFPDFEVTLIDYDPESVIQKEIMDLSGDCLIRFNRFFTNDNLNHWVYRLTFTKALW